jgi:hypothetical protein
MVVMTEGQVYAVRAAQASASILRETCPLPDVFGRLLGTPKGFFPMYDALGCGEDLQ